MLFADHSVAELYAASHFPTAQHVRRLLQEFGFTPITKIGNAEYWNRGIKLVILAWEGDAPGNVPANDMQGATIVKIHGDDTFMLSLD